jgi:hypothetical protein
VPNSDFNFHARVDTFKFLGRVYGVLGPVGKLKLSVT